jgi:hypothetical protein
MVQKKTVSGFQQQSASEFLNGHLPQPREKSGRMPQRVFEAEVLVAGTGDTGAARALTHLLALEQQQRNKLFVFDNYTLSLLIWLPLVRFG